MKTKVIAKGAEAVIYKEASKIIKDRISKSYRHKELDIKIRKRRTKSEAKLIEKANKIIPSPKILSSTNSNHLSAHSDNSYLITMQNIQGKKLSEHLGKLKNPELTKVCKQIGKNIALLHNSGLIHGDLTTSNMIYNAQSKSVYFIDFGLGFHSDRIEDKAVDLHLINQALEAKHYAIHKQAFKSVLQAYKKQVKNPQFILTRLQKVEKRGRYKQQY